jgi:hypothetical protein
MWGLVYVMWVVIGLIGGVEGGQYGTGCTGVFKTPGGSKKEDDCFPQDFSHSPQIYGYRLPT